MAKRGQWSDEEKTAYHEAGHVVVAYLKRRKFTSVSINAHGDSYGRVLFSELSSFEHINSCDPKTLKLIETNISILYAGPLAVWFLTGKYDFEGAGSDFALADMLVHYAAETIDEAEAYLSLVKARTTNLLWWPNNWYAVEKLAQELRSKRNIGYRRAREIVGTAVKTMPHDGDPELFMLVKQWTKKQKDTRKR